MEDCCLFQEMFDTCALPKDSTLLTVITSSFLRQLTDSDLQLLKETEQELDIHLINSINLFKAEH